MTSRTDAAILPLCVDWKVCAYKKHNHAISMDMVVFDHMSLPSMCSCAAVACQKKQFSCPFGSEKGYLQTRIVPKVLARRSKKCYFGS